MPLNAGKYKAKGGNYGFQKLRKGMCSMRAHLHRWA